MDRASSAARSCRGSPPPATRCWRRRTPRPTCSSPAGRPRLRGRGRRRRARPPRLGGGPGYATSPANPAWLSASLELATRLRRCRRPAHRRGRELRRARSRAADAVRRREAGTAPRPARPGRDPRPRAGLGAAVLPVRAGRASRAPGRLARRQPRRRPGGARERRPSAPRLPRRPRCGRGYRRCSPRAARPGLFDVASGSAPAVADIARALADGGRPPGPAAPRRAAAR